MKQPHFFQRFHWHLYLVVVVAALLSYWNTLDGELLFDDHPAIINVNEFI
jgi:hypothetical protein